MVLRVVNTTPRAAWPLRVLSVGVATSSSSTHDTLSSTILSLRPSLPRLVADKAVALVGVGAAKFKASGPPGPARAGPSSLFGDDGRGGHAAGRCGPIGIGLLGALRYAARLVHGDAHARARMCGQRARHATRAAGSVVAATADAVADAQSGVVDVVETQGGGLWRTTDRVPFEDGRISSF